MNRQTRYHFLSFVFASIFLISHSSAQEGCGVKNVILIIGDGMGVAQMEYLGASQPGPITVESFPVIGLQKTASASTLITDSGAAATAMSCGLKTNNYSIGMDADSMPCKGIFQIAEEHGMRTGIVVTSSLVHATPAAFYAHQRLRGFHEAIASDLVSSGVDYFVGGGEIFFQNRYADDRNLIREMSDRGYVISDYDKKSFKAFSRITAPLMGYFTASAEPQPVTDGRVPLATITAHALQTLSKYGEGGFVLMIEASQVDYALHRNDPAYLLSELRDMDAAIMAAMTFASDRDDTLVLVTGDHETGQLSFRSSVPGKKVHIEFLSNNHTEMMIPVYAYGACAGLFSGIYENTEIFWRIRQALGL